MPDPRDAAGRRAFLAAMGTTAVAGCPTLPDGDRSGDGTGGESPADDAEDPPEDGGDPSGDGEDPPGDGGADPDWDLPSGTPLDASVDPEPLVVDLEIPWDLAFGPNGDLFVTERPGRLLRFDAASVLDAGGDPIVPGDLPGERRQSWPGEQVQGVALHPSYPDPAFVYVYYGADGQNHVGRFDAAAADPRSTLEVLVSGIERAAGIGGRLAFGPEGDLWITAGTSERDPAQDPSRLGGSILRLTPDGEPSPANPALDGADPRVFAYGHRNPQGLAWLPDGTPLCTDHGPEGRDEVKRLQPGANYGWPVVRGGPDDPAYESYAANEGVHPPLVNTGPDVTWAPSGCVFYRGDEVPAWRHRLVIGTLRGRHVNVVTLLPPGVEQPPLDGTSRRFDAAWLDGAYTATSHRVLEGVLGRVRHVAEGPGGELLALTSNQDGRSEVAEFPRERDDVLVRIESG